ncbi:putative membrane protein [Sinomonas atrocyanea]|uniref:DUF998 domain-containing protein n=1 Tax=Sinomonas atrocyanea TaxID=37927 RepID=UPI00278A848B|nr:DUF998 domain-containing protein [Sinomonas atrocyanea]MDQ0261354.1 putative membrane protein [Sinomonas atrocyanea]
MESEVENVKPMADGGGTASWWRRSPRVQRILLVAPIPAVAVYVIGDVVSTVGYNGYSFRDQWISELTAFGSPVRPLMVTVILIHGVLLLAFSFGLLQVARRRSALWWIGAIGVAGFVVVGIPTHTFWAMNSRGMQPGFNDAMHATLSLVFSASIMATMILSAVAYRGWFRLYALASLAAVAFFGAASGIAIRGIDQDNTPWAGGFERIDAYTYFAWLVVLAVMVDRRELGGVRLTRRVGRRPWRGAPA